MAREKRSARVIKMHKKDWSNLHDVDQRLTDGEIEIGGKELTAAEVKDYMYKNINRIIQLGRRNWNPFDTILIIEEGKPEEGWDELH